jgi:hypothetical protein
MQATLTTRDELRQLIAEALADFQTPPPPQPEPETYIHGLQALADFLGVGITTAWQLKKSGKFSYYQAGKKLFFKKSEVLAALKNK